jgi:hypothetical protein
MTAKKNDNVTQVAASKMMADSEIRHVAGRLVHAMDWIATLKANPLTVTQQQVNQANMAVYASAADVAPLMGEVGLLRLLLNEATGYLIDVARTGSPDERIVALTTLGLMQIEIAGKEKPTDGEDHS